MSIFSNPILSGNYDNIAIKGKQYYVPWKSAVITKSDKVLARIELKEEGKPSGDTLKFVSTSGLPVVATRLSDTLYEVQVDGISSKGEFGILATYNYPDSTGKEIIVTAGQANISAYAIQEMNLVIVPVNQSAGVLAKVIEDSINAIYSQAATNWSVSLEEQLVIDEVNTASLDDGDAGLLSNYTDDMEAIIKAYSEKKAGNIDKNTCYLFLVEGAKSGSGKEGYMPLKNQYGFIFTGNCAKVEHTIAHELGHGPFRLYHTFSEHNEYMQTEGSTNNLMDYTKTKEKNLYKYQWDLIHDPESMIGLFQDEEEGEAINLNFIGVAIKEESVFFAPQVDNYKCIFKLTKKSEVATKELVGVFKITDVNNELIFIEAKELEAGESTGEFIWDGIINKGDKSDKSISVYQLPFRVELSVYDRKSINLLYGESSYGSVIDKNKFEEPSWLIKEGSYGNLLELTLRKIYDDILHENNTFSILDLWSDESKDELIERIIPHVNSTFHIQSENGEYKYSRRLFCEKNNILEKDIYLEVNKASKYECDKLKQLSSIIINRYNSVFLDVNRYSENYNTRIEEIISYLYKYIVEDFGENYQKYTWVDGRSTEIMDPRTYYKNGSYDFIKLENDVKELLLVKYPTWATNRNTDELIAKKSTNVMYILSRFSEYMYIKGVEEIPGIESYAVENLRSIYREYYVETETLEKGFQCEWKVLEASRIEREKAILSQRLRNEAELSKHLQALEEGKTSAWMDIGFGSATVVGSVLAVIFTEGGAVPVAYTSIGFGADQVVGGVLQLQAIKNDFFDENKEYKFVKGLVVNNIKDEATANFVGGIYDFSSIIAGVFSGGATVSSMDINGKVMQEIIKSYASGAEFVNVVYNSQEYKVKLNKK